MARAAVGSARSHPGLTHVGSGQGLSVKDALVDSTGATHVRLRRTLHGLWVVGGDLVVHRSATGALTGESQTLRSPLRRGPPPACPPRGPSPR